jgi:hypothetical protein
MRSAPGLISYPRLSLCAPALTRSFIGPEAPELQKKYLIREGFFRLSDLASASVA